MKGRKVKFRSGSQSFKILTFVIPSPTRLEFTELSLEISERKEALPKRSLSTMSNKIEQLN